MNLFEILLIEILANSVYNSDGSSTAGLSFGGDLHDPLRGSGEFVMQLIARKLRSGRG
jgi:hypothetical protein